MDRKYRREILLQHTEDFNERPRKGWKICVRTPDGIKPIATRRGFHRKYKKLEDALSWISENRKDYRVEMQCFGYKGSLIPEIVKK